MALQYNNYEFIIDVLVKSLVWKIPVFISVPRTCLNDVTPLLGRTIAVEVHLHHCWNSWLLVSSLGSWNFLLANKIRPWRFNCWVASVNNRPLITNSWFPLDVDWSFCSLARSVVGCFWRVDCWVADCGVQCWSLVRSSSAWSLDLDSQEASKWG